MSTRIKNCIITDYKRGISFDVMSQVYSESKQSISKVVSKYIAMRQTC